MSSGCPFAHTQPNKGLDNAIETAIREALVNFKVNACPIAVRLAWHAAGTFEASSKTGGSDGATMRFDPEASDPANAGLNIMRDLLIPVKQKFPFVSFADIWTRAGVFAVKFAGGPDVPFFYGRTDDADGSGCPANGRLPDAAQGAKHLREVFNRMGFNDREIVCLSGAHTLGSCHKSRSGFDGPWTANPLKFDNSYFKVLLELEWTERKWDGPTQYQDPSGKLMMLPTDMAVKTDPEFRKHAEAYAADEALFFREFSAAFGKLLSLGTSHDPSKTPAEAAAAVDANHQFREFAMHGSLERMKALGDAVDVDSTEPLTNRTAMHKAAFWGHGHVIEYLVERGANVNVQDMSGATPLHDASQFGHASVLAALRKAGADESLQDKSGRTASDVAVAYGKSKAEGASGEPAKRTKAEPAADAAAGGGGAGGGSK